ncbi:orotate phosphoribosyltransferase [Methanomicrobium sp. W14]|uniref:orotate phosphoribosyltransferase-like protein n=1 Tax=Methanomicrobium sp. W14 TaxID=2817839 RepID=UPI001AE30D00|nr:orotate phosphoribosyltransferase-like protein [Methanomicrobium sp. W14]MBP2133608.1 orotate phosphoribosyltransferase [Methanomicrobium sp. W14]
MSSLDELIEKAKNLHSEGRSSSQIADEMSLSIETVTWLLTQQKGEKAAPKDIVIDWSSISGHADMLRDASLMLLKRFIHAQEESMPDECEENFPDVIIGVAHSGIPIAAMIASESDCLFTMFHPKKHATGDKPTGSLNSSFADVLGRKCLIVDDVITSGNTVAEAVSVVRNHGGIPIGICTLFDKLGISETAGVPVYSLVKVSRID